MQELQFPVEECQELPSCPSRLQQRDISPHMEEISDYLRGKTKKTGEQMSMKQCLAFYEAKIIINMYIC
jgi:hypothetical protein